MTDVKNPLEPSPWTVFTTAEVAALLKVSKPTVRRLKDDGDLVALPGVRPFRFTATNLHNYLVRKK